MNAIVQHSQPSAGLVPHDMNAALRLAEMMSTGKLVPTHLQRSPGDCLMVVEQAMRWRMSPFAVAQSTSVIQGKLMFEGKLVAAALQASGILSTRFDYEFDGQGDGRSVTATATIRGETKPKAVTVAIKEVKTSNGMWTKQPDQQLIYSANRIWARRFTPEVMLGVYTPEEFNQGSTGSAENFDGQTVTTTAEPVRHAAPSVASGLSERFSAQMQTWCDACTSLDEVATVEQRKPVQDALANAPTEAVQEIRRYLDVARKRIAPEEVAYAVSQPDDTDEMPS